MENKEKLKAISREKILCYDVETTGLNLDDEVVQLSIINGNGDVLFNEYIRPKHHTSWSEAEAIHEISPKDVENKPTIDHWINTLQKIFDDAELLVGYNNIYFDDHFINSVGVEFPKDVLEFDVMLEFAEIYGEWNDYFEDWKWQKLSVCSKYYDYHGDGKFHDSLEDVRATLHCFFKMIGNDDETDIQKD